MTPIKTPNCNFTYTAPPGMPDCGDLPCRVHETGTTSFWLPDADELALLVAGGTVAFTHCGKGHPVVALGVIPAVHSQPSVVAHGSLAAYVADDLLAALKRIKPGETIECHHPKTVGPPTNTGVVCCKNEDGYDMHIHVGLWGKVGETLVWTYACLSAGNVSRMGLPISAGPPSTQPL